MGHGFDDIKKTFEARTAIEKKKIQSLLDEFEKGRAQLEAECKTYTVDMKKCIILYGE